MISQDELSGGVIRPRIMVTWRREPVLRFAGEREHVDSKTGIARFGPASLGLDRHPAAIRLGYVGSGKSIASARAWFAITEPGIHGSPADGLPDFPGFFADRGFFSELVHRDQLAERITAHELAEVKKPKKLADRFDAAVALVSDHVRMLATRDERPDVIILALPQELLEVTARVKYRDPLRGLVYRNFRRALKAELMRHQIPTQILLERVTEAADDAPSVDHRSRVAWNLYTALYFKAGGVPWRPVGLRPSTCYIGISFHRPLGSTDNTLFTSVAQAFNEHGAGVVLRGPDFQWDPEKGPSPHLTADQADALLRLTLRRYRSETHHPPARVVVHKTSRFWDDEREGFQQALSEVAEFDLVSVSPTSEIRLVRAGRYPALRGTVFSLGSISYLYTTGYIPALQRYPHGHVPAPLQIADHHGDSALTELVDEILILTKMNWNSAAFAGALPITMRFSRLVGDIMREIPAGREPMPQFKFYT